MVTRFRVWTNRPTEHINLHVSLVSPLSKSYRNAFSDPNWQNAMRDKYHALIKNKTWILVRRPLDTNIVRCMWLFCHKYLADGTLSRYKARLVTNDSTQLEGVDVDETFSLDSVHPDYVCLLQRSLYGLKQASRAWSKRQGTDTAYLLLYVDDIDLTASSKILLQQIIRSLHQEAHVVNCNPSRTPIDTEFKLGSDGDPVSDSTLYRSLAGSLQYLTFTRPDISYAVQQVCLYMHDPREPHFSALKRILRYVRGTLYYGLQLFSSSTTDLVAYSDADWAGCPTTRFLSLLSYATNHT
ncbi:ribonuclease H-like domain-containing protein [Tanacetum coccineum]